MVSISVETQEQTEARLKALISYCEVHYFEQSYAYEEFPLEAFARQASSKALALVRDETCWSQLLPCSDKDKELFFMFRFHFPEEKDNSGFVGWLASYLKEHLGTGVFVVCGQNTKRGGIYDYWGAPWQLKDQVINELNKLRGTGGN